MCKGRFKRIQCDHNRGGPARHPLTGAWLCPLQKNCCFAHTDDNWDRINEEMAEVRQKVFIAMFKDKWCLPNPILVEIGVLEDDDPETKRNPHIRRPAQPVQRRHERSRSPRSQPSTTPDAQRQVPRVRDHTTKSRSDSGSNNNSPRDKDMAVGDYEQDIAYAHEEGMEPPLPDDGDVHA